MRRWISALLCLAMLLSVSCTKAGKAEGTLSMVQIDAGKSDALAFITPQGTAFLVDTGLKATSERVEEVLGALGISDIEAVFITHGHKDHIGGLKSILKNHEVKTIYTAFVDTATYSDEELVRIGSSGADHRYLRAGDTLAIGGADISVQSPARPYSDEEDDNNNSLVLRVAWGDTAFLLMGDATATIESNLLKAGDALQADVIKLGHHGQADASGAAFLQAVAPSFAAITGCRADDADSPADEVLERLEGMGVEYYVNDGSRAAVIYKSDATHIEVSFIATEALVSTN